MQLIETARKRIDQRLHILADKLVEDNQFIGTKRVKDSIYFVEGAMSVLALGMCDLILGKQDDEVLEGYQQWEDLMGQFRQLQDRRSIKFENEAQVIDWPGESSLDIPMRTLAVDKKEYSHHAGSYDRTTPVPA